MAKERVQTGPCVSVIVTAYNVARYLERCLDSVVGQTYQNLDVLLVDDGSTDETPRIAREYARKDKRIRILRHENQGISYTRNRGLAEARGEWLTFVDGDDAMEERAVETLLEAALSNGSMLCVAEHYVCARDRSESARRVCLKASVCRDAESAQAYFLTGGRGDCFAWAKLYHRTVFSEIRYPVGRIYEDIWVLPRILDAAGGCVVIDRPVYYYFLRRGSLTYTKKAKIQLQALEASLAYAEYIKEHYPGLFSHAETRVVESCLFLMGRICRAGRRQNKEEWDRVVDALREHGGSARLDSVYLRTATALSRISPALVGHLCNVYSTLKNGT